MSRVSECFGSSLHRASLVNVRLRRHVRSRFSRRRRGRSISRSSARHVCIIAIGSTKFALHLLDQVLYLGIVRILCHIGRVLADVNKCSRHLRILHATGRNQPHVSTL